MSRTGSALRRAPGLLAILLLVGAAVGCAKLARPRSDAGSAQAAITAPGLASTMRFLADDSLEGRGPGTPGDLLARRFIASEMAQLGLRPGAEDGGFEQRVELLGLSASPPPVWTFAGRAGSLQLARSEDFIVTTGTSDAKARLIAARLVFVGYGIQAPEEGWDDFKGADLRGKVLVFLNNDPDWDPELFAGVRRLYYGRWTYKFESAARQGAAGAIVIHTPDSAGYPWQTVQTSWSGENARLPAGAEPGPPIQAWLSEDAARRLFAHGGHDLDALTAAARSRDFRPVPLGVTTSIEVRNASRPYETANVIGVLPGSDPALADQAIVYTAHHDHLGVRVDEKGERHIYNGAVDNASGVAQLLAVARAFAEAPAPRRQVIFLAVAAEEQGLRGSQWWVRHPTHPLGKVVAALNFDGGNVLGRTRDVAVVGLGRSSLDRLAAEAAARQGRRLVDERFPDRGAFYRSDQFSFAQAGVPVLYAQSGTDYVGRPEGWGRQQVDAWVAAHYHQRSDDFDPSWNLDGLVEDARLLFEVGRALADSAEWPAWTPGDEFEAIRARSLAPAPAVP